MRNKELEKEEPVYGRRRRRRRSRQVLVAH
jgi:hypothetical protein